MKKSVLQTGLAFVYDVKNKTRGILMSKWLEALKNNSLDEIKSLLDAKEDVNEENESGESVLACALRSRCDFSLLMFLVEHGADIYAFDNEGVSVFDMAVTYNNIEMVEFLMSKGVDVNATRRRSGFTPLMCAACYGRNAIVELFLAKGANKNAVDSKGLNATDFARKMNKKSILKLLSYDENAPKNTTYAR